MKRKLCALISSVLALTVTCTTPVFASTPQIEENDMVAAKYALRNWADSQVSTTSTLTISEDETELIEELLLQYVSNPNANKDEIEATLANKHVYLLKDDSDNVETYSDGADVFISNPIISYNANTKKWIVTMGGYWINDSAWMAEDPERVYPTNIGGPDQFGISIYDTTGSATVSSQSAFINDGAGTEKTTQSRSTGNGKKGIGFSLQDYVQWRSPNTAVTYVGKRFGAVMNYDSNFVNFSGTMVAYYVHTYNTTKISSITLGLSDSPSISVSWSGGEDSFIAESGEKPF